MNKLPTIEQTLASTPRSIFQCIVQGNNQISLQEQSGLKIKITSDNPCLIDHESKTRWLEYMRNHYQNIKNAPSTKPDSKKTSGTDKPSKLIKTDTPFRYASGGALPVVLKNNQLYFMMFHRDIFPEGWNIANGSSSDLEDLKNPQRIVHREFHEELMILNREKNQLFSFESPSMPNNREIEIAQTQWQNITGVPLTQYKKPTKWIPGPHELTVKYNSEEAIKSNGYFISITPEDFSIELDKIICFELHKGESLIDGELFNNRLINRLIGLFRVEPLISHLKKGIEHFIPDIFFYDGIEYSQKSFNQILRQSQKDHEWKHYTPIKSLKEQFSLCPITKSIIKQAISHNIRF